MPQMDIDTTDPDRAERRPVPAEALIRLKASVDYFGKQRLREKEDLGFQVPENQWEPGAAASRDAAIVDGVAIPARPMISIPKLDQPIQLILNQERSAHLGVNIHPVSEDADDDTAEVLQGLYRAIERDSRAGLARSWAFDRAVKAGMGAYRVNTVWDEDSDNPFDQKIVIQRLLHQDAVYLDPAAQEPDWSDGEWAFVTTWVPLDTYRRLYPESDLAGFESGELEALVADAPEWVNLDGERPAVLVAEYFRKEYVEKDWVRLDDGSFAYADKIPQGRRVAAGTAGKTRSVQVPVVKWSKINAIEELEDEDWNGRYIPLIPVIGRELQPFDSERRWVGIIGPNKGAARMFNYAASGAIELSALEPRAPYQMYAGQQEGYEDMWQQANVRNFPYMLSNPISLPGGVPAPLPSRTQTDVSKLGPSMLLLDKADQFIQAGTATFDPSLGNMPQRDRSGKAIMALQQQSDAGNSHFLSSLADISMTYEAKVVMDLIPKIYDRPGRVARILDGEDNSRQVMLNAPFMPGKDGGRPVAVPSGIGIGAPPPKTVKEYNLDAGTYGVSVTIGKSFQTRMQQGAETIGALLEGNPALLPLLGATYFRFRDEPGMAEIAKILKKVREKEYPGIDKDDDAGEPDAAQLQQQLQQAQQIMEQGQQEMAALRHQLEMEQAKAQATLQKAEMDNQTKMAVEQGKASAAAEREQAKEDAAARLLQMEQAFDLMITRMEHEHQARMAAAAAATAEEASERQMSHATDERLKASMGEDDGA